MAEGKSAMFVLLQFFGKKDGQTTKEFAAEVKELSDEEKLELASLAAQELGIELQE